MGDLEFIPAISCYRCVTFTRCFPGCADFFAEWYECGKLSMWLNNMSVFFLSLIVL